MRALSSETGQSSASAGPASAGGRSVIIQVMRPPMSYPSSFRLRGPATSHAAQLPVLGSPFESLPPPWRASKTSPVRPALASVARLAVVLRRGAGPAPSRRAPGRPRPHTARAFSHDVRLGCWGQAVTRSVPRSPRGLHLTDVIRDLPRCRLFPLFAPAGPRFDCFETVPVRFVRSPPARPAGRPARLVTAAHVCDSASASNPSRQCVPCWPIPRRDPSHRVRRVRLGPSRLPGLKQSSGVTRPSRPSRAIVAPGLRFGEGAGPGPVRRAPAAGHGPGRLGVGCARVS